MAAIAKLIKPTLEEVQKMKRLLTLSILLGTLFPGVYSEETGWNYKQTTLQSFYLFFADSLASINCLLIFLIYLF